MTYLRVIWKTALPDEPCETYMELDDNRMEQRKIEFFSSGAVGFADKNHETVETFTGLSFVEIPNLTIIAADPQFQPTEITQADFEHVWRRVTKAPSA